ncbi:MAG TPA: hypothetical protein VF528_13495 [Pyrinomonadaceae bacterium]
MIGLLLLALSLSGWSGVLAAAFCAHDGAKPSTTTEDHDCCPSKLDGPTEHCGAASTSSSTHEASAAKQMHAAALKTERVASSTSEIALRQATQNCLHCAANSGLPSTFVVTREPEQKKRAANLAASQTLKPVVPPVASFAPAPAARQNAPPCIAARRHLLLGVLVI